MDAIAEVVTIAKSVLYEKEKGFCAVIAIDIRNAFNTARWDEIMKALKSKQIPEYLIQLIDSYLRDRTLMYETDAGIKEYKISAGVPQGSVLGSLFWNIIYDAFLDMKLLGGAFIVGYADDAAVVVTARTAETLSIVANDSLRRAN